MKRREHLRVPPLAKARRMGHPRSGWSRSLIQSVRRSSESSTWSVRRLSQWNSMGGCARANAHERGSFLTEQWKQVVHWSLAFSDRVSGTQCFCYILLGGAGRLEGGLPIDQRTEQCGREGAASSMRRTRLRSVHIQANPAGPQPSARNQLAGLRSPPVTTTFSASLPYSAVSAWRRAAAAGNRTFADQNAELPKVGSDPTNLSQQLFADHLNPMILDERRPGTGSQDRIEDDPISSEESRWERRSRPGTRQPHGPPQRFQASRS